MKRLASDLMKPSLGVELGPEDILIDEQKTGDMIGWSRSTLQKDRIGLRRLPFVKLGRRVMYRLSDIRDFVAKSIHGPP